MPSTQPIKITVSKDQWEKLTQQLNYLFKDIYHYLDEIKSVDNKTFEMGDASFSSLTASRLLALDASNVVETTDIVNWIAGTTNQITVTDNGDGTVTLSIPSGAVLTLAGLTLVNAITEFSTDGTLVGNSDSAVPTEKAVKTYVDLRAGIGALLGLSDVNLVAIADNELLQYNSGTSKWINQTLAEAGVQATLTFGIANTNAAQIDDADVADNDYAKFTATGLEGRSYAEVKTDLSLNSVENTALSTWAGTTNITILGTIAFGIWQGTTIAVNQGGTGQTTYTNGQLLIGNTTGNTLTKATLTQGTGITIANGTGTITITNASPNVDQNLWKTIAGDAGSVAANTTTDTLTIAGAGIASTAVAGDTLTITATEADTLDTVTGRGATTNNAVTFAGVTLNNTGLHLLDRNATHDLIVKPGSDLTADRTYTITTGDSDRTITLQGNPTLDDWFDQAVKVASTPKFAANLHRRTIPSGTTITVPDDYEFIVGNGYNIEGVLDIQGSGALLVI